MKQFESLLKSEITKINKFVQKRDGRDSRISGYSYCSKPDDMGYVKVTCEICSNNYSEREDDVYIYVYMPDRRRSFVAEYSV